MLAVPLLLGTAASRFDVGQLLLAATALSGYLAIWSAQGWLRVRQRQHFHLPLLTYATAFVIFTVTLVLVHPGVLAAAVVVVPAGVLILVVSRLRNPRSLAVTLLQVAAALVLVPTAAVVADPSTPMMPMRATVARATLVAGIYLGGSVLVVRSVIREREHAWFAVGSVLMHILALTTAAVLLPWPYAILVGLLAVRAALLPLARRWLVSSRPLRPIQVGLVELGCAIAVVGLAFLAPP